MAALLPAGRSSKSDHGIESGKDYVSAVVDIRLHVFSRRAAGSYLRYGARVITVEPRIPPPAGHCSHTITPLSLMEGWPWMSGPDVTTTGVLVPADSL